MKLSSHFWIALLAIWQNLHASSPEVLTQIASPVISFSVIENIQRDLPANEFVHSPLLGYLHSEWAGDQTNVSITKGQAIAYFYQISNETNQVILRGRVTDTSGAPLAGALISAKIYLNTIDQATADSNGEYDILGLQGGAYSLSASKEKYQTSVRALTLRSNTAFQDFKLEALVQSPSIQQVDRSATFQLPQIGSLGETLMIFNGTTFENITLTNRPLQNQMTVVFTHGWNSDPTVWAQSMASNMMGRGVMANMLAFDWRFAARSAIGPFTESSTPGEGLFLGKLLQDALGTEYSYPVHFIGHSLGAIVNASAANYLQGDQTAQQGTSSTPWTQAPIHVTLLDEGELATAGIVGAGRMVFDGLTASLIWLGLPLANPPGGASLGWKSPIPIHATWIDNYISSYGFYHPRAVNVRLDRASFLVSGIEQQHAYAYKWYEMSVKNPTDSILGFQRSYEASYASLSSFTFPPPSSEFPLGVLYGQHITGSNPLMVSYLTENGTGLGALARDFAQGISGTIQVAGNVTTTIQDSARNSSQLLIQAFEYVTNLAAEGGQAVLDLFDPAVLRIRLDTSPSSFVETRSQTLHALPSAPMIWLPMRFPSNVTAMVFDFAVEGDPVNDEVVCSIGATNLFSVEAKYIPTNSISTSQLIDISRWAGMTNELFFGLLGNTSEISTLFVENIRFFTVDGPALKIVEHEDGLSLNWPIGGRYSLETATNLNSPDWEAKTNVPVLSGDVFTTSEPQYEQKRFFRLVPK